MLSEANLLRQKRAIKSQVTIPFINYELLQLLLARSHKFYNDDRTLQVIYTEGQKPTYSIRRFIIITITNRGIACLR